MHLEEGEMRTNKRLACIQHQHARQNEEGKNRALFIVVVLVVLAKYTSNEQHNGMQIVSFLSGVYPAANCTVSLMGKVELF